MRRRLPSGSAWNRVAVCPASAVLPAADSVSPYSTSGQNVHAYLQAVNEKGRDAALALVPEEDRPLCEALDTGSMPTDPNAFAAEVALAYDAVTGTARELGRGIERRYEEAAAKQGKPLAPTEIVVTVDVAALMDSDAIFVGDWKKGWSHGRLTPPPDRNWQLKIGLLAACRAWGRKRGRVQIIRIFDDGEHYLSTANLSERDLQAFELQLATDAARVFLDRQAYEAGEEPRAVTGPHCTNCASFQFCPSNLALARELGNVPAQIKEEVTALLTPVTAGQAYARLRQAQAVLGEIEEAIRMFARETPIPLGDGFVYGVREEAKRNIDGKVAHDALKVALGASYVPLAESVEVTQAGIEKAVRRWLEDHPGSGETIKSLKDKALAEIEKRGGLKVTTAGKLIEHKPKRAA